MSPPPQIRVNRGRGSALSPDHNDQDYQDDDDMDDHDDQDEYDDYKDDPLEPHHHLHPPPHILL